MNFSRAPRWLLLGLFLALVGLSSGCTTPETADNESERPWNAPRSWEHGLPGFMNEGR
jgi:hypothetical protein